MSSTSSKQRLATSTSTGPVANSGPMTNPTKDSLEIELDVLYSWLDELVATNKRRMVQQRIMEIEEDILHYYPD